MKPTKSKSMWSGCYDDVYNHGCGGAKECWSFNSASVEKRFMIPVDLPPPYKFKPKWVLSCLQTAESRQRKTGKHREKMDIGNEIKKQT